MVKRIKQFRITLDEKNLLEAADFALKRQLESIYSDRKNAKGLNADYWDGLKAHIIGACGERAASIFLGCPHELRLNSFKGADLMDIIQVRTRTKPRHDLPIELDANDDHVYIHVLAESPADFIIRGYFWAQDAKQNSRWIKDPGKRNSRAYFVPPKALLDISEFEGIYSDNV